jgi:putative transposase
MSMPEGTLRRRLLPHWDVEGKPFFVTACLDGSIPASGLRAIRNYRDQLASRLCPAGADRHEWQQRNNKLLFALVDGLLDHQSPVQHLAEPSLAKLVESGMLHFAGERYGIIAWCVMPSHYHWLFQPILSWTNEVLSSGKSNARLQKSPREMIQQNLQSWTARVCNKALGRSGQFWQHETWDHWVRDEDELVRIVRYIENNPVKAGLVQSPSAWGWSSSRIRLQHGLRDNDSIPPDVIAGLRQGD